MKKALFSALIVTALSLATVGCASVPLAADIPMEMTVIELSQKGQEAIDVNNYKAAEVFYQVLIDRYGADPAARVGAEFEIAHIRIKQKKYDDAKARLETIVAYYDVAGAASLPREYLVLAKIDLARIETATKGKNAAKPAQ